MNKKIPISIITGFLGAGKTTFLNQLLREHNKQFAIIENEFGEVSIDSHIVVGVEDNKLFELSNGCICCSSNAEFGIVINKLIYENQNVEHILVETTGVADPSAVLESIIGDAHIMQKVEIDSVICLVDAPNFLAASTTPPEAHKQILLADLIILNKTDIISAEGLISAKSNVRKINPSAELVETRHGSFGDAKVIDRFDFSGIKAEQSIFDFNNIQSTVSKKHTHGIISFSFQFEGSFDANKFPFWLWHFLNLNKDNIFRIKGIINYEGVNTKMLIQAVGASHTISPLGDWPRDEPLCNTMVFIGKKISKEDLSSSLCQLLV